MSYANTPHTTAQGMICGSNHLLGEKLCCTPQLGSPLRVPRTKPNAKSSWPPPWTFMCCSRPLTKPNPDLCRSRLYCSSWSLTSCSTSKSRVPATDHRFKQENEANKNTKKIIYIYIYGYNQQLCSVDGLIRIASHSSNLRLRRCFSHEIRAVAFSCTCGQYLQGSNRSLRLHRQMLQNKKHGLRYCENRPNASS